MSIEGQLITSEATDLAFADIRDQLEAVADENAKMVFDYKTPDGEKAAKTQIRTLRKLDKRVGEIHKEIKAEALAQCRSIDAVKRDLCGRIADMVAVHKEPLEAIAAAEAERVQRIADLMAALFAYDDKFDAVTETSVLVAGLEKLNAIEITSEYGERMAEATDLKESIAAELSGKIEAARKRDAEAAELAELRKQKEDRERAEREKKIAEDAAAKAVKDAEEKAAAQLKEVEDKAKREAEESAERERLAVEAKERAEREAAEAKAKALEKSRKAKADAEAAEAKRLENETYVASIRASAIDDLTGKCGITRHEAIIVVDLIQDGEINSVSINF